MKRFLVQIFDTMRDQKISGKMLNEVKEALEYKDIAYLYNCTRMKQTSNRADGLCDLLSRQFIVAKDEELETQILELFIGSHFRLTDYGRYLEHLFFITSNKCKDKQGELEVLIEEIQTLVNHSTNTLDICDIKSLRHISNVIGKFKDLFTRLHVLFTESHEEAKAPIEIKVLSASNLDYTFTKLFLKTKSYSALISFLKLCSEVKLGAAKNVLEGNQNLGLHAVTVSKELMQVVAMCNYVLINLCKSSNKARV